VNHEINGQVAGKSFDQAELDRQMIALDGTPNLSRLGANAVLAVSLSFARACANERGVPLYEQFAELISEPQPTIPQLTANLFSGGKHAGGQVPMQDVLLVPDSSRSLDDALSMTCAIYQAATELTARKYAARPLRADEGGLAPPFPSAEAMIADAVESIRLAGYAPGKDVSLAVDVAASHFYRDGKYHLGDQSLESSGMIALLGTWLDRFPIVSVEDGLSQDDWANWPRLHEAIGARALVLGDDLLCTNPVRIERAITSRAANALLLKVNQIGTLTEASRALLLARRAGWSITASARSGETEDDWLADLAVGWRAQQIKVGSITGS
jgi:enolase